jgi:hypothetical protein
MIGWMTLNRLAAVAAALMATGGAATMLAALVADSGPWWRGYVSEAGTAGQPYAVAYRWGLLLLAVGVALLAVALRPGGRPAAVPPGGLRGGDAAAGDPTGGAVAARRLLRRAVAVGHHRGDALAAVCLAAAAVLAGTAGVVPCSDRCPLPPYEPTTVADILHTAASILGMFVLVAAMAAVSLTGLLTATRRLAAAAVALMVPLGAALGLTMLVAGRNALGAVLERLLLVVAVSWLAGTALLTASAPPREKPHRSAERQASR